jgi:hypothetical protein
VCSGAGKFWHSGEEFAGVGIFWLVEHLFGRTQFEKLASAHDSDAGSEQPLSPTTANVSPRVTEKLTLSTAMKQMPSDAWEKTPPPRR